jgi:hypothetical protein
VRFERPPVVQRLGSVIFERGENLLGS